MPSKAIAVDGDTKFNTSTKNHSSDENKTGHWQLDTKFSFVTKGDEWQVDNKLVEIGATGGWSYVGGSTGKPPVPVAPFADTVTLTASPTRLKDNGRNVLRDGDQTSTADGNGISVSASQTKLTTD